MALFGMAWRVENPTPSIQNSSGEAVLECGQAGGRHHSVYPPDRTLSVDDAWVDAIELLELGLYYE